MKNHHSVITNYRSLLFYYEMPQFREFLYQSGTENRRETKLLTRCNFRRHFLCPTAVKCVFISDYLDFCWVLFFASNWIFSKTRHPVATLRVLKGINLNFFIVLLHKKYVNLVNGRPVRFVNHIDDVNLCKITKPCITYYFYETRSLLVLT